MNEHVDFQNALALAIASGIGGDGEMMIQEVLWSGSLSNIGDEGALSKTIDNYDLILIECNATPPDTTTVWNNIILPSQNGVLTDINDNYGDSIYLYITFPNKNTVRLNHKLSKVFTNGAVTKVIGIKFTGTKSIDYSTEEQVIGKWIDGKPLYQKTIVLSNAVEVGTGWYQIPVDVSTLNINKLVKSIMINDTATLNGFSVQIRKGTPDQLWVLSTITWIYKEITIQYTKTTD